jgi:hypothetical protein
MKALLCLFASCTLAVSGLAKETNEMTVWGLSIGTNVFKKANVRRGGPSSAIIRHNEGFTVVASTNLPAYIRTNLFPTPERRIPPEVKAYLETNSTLKAEYRAALEDNKADLQTVKEFVARDERNAFYAEEARKQRVKEQAEDALFALRNPELSDRIDKAIAARKVCLGMRKKDVVAAWGEPETENRTVTYRGSRSLWFYKRSILRFDDDELVAVNVTR